MTGSAQHGDMIKRAAVIEARNRFNAQMGSPMTNLSSWFELRYGDYINSNQEVKSWLTRKKQ